MSELARERGRECEGGEKGEREGREGERGGGREEKREVGEGVR